jgi:hypothetical protein
MSTQFTNRQWRLPNNENKDKQSNYSMDFDGNIQRVTASNFSGLANKNSGSFSLWFKTTNTTTNAGKCIFSIPYSAGGNGFDLYINNSTSFKSFLKTTTFTTTTTNTITYGDGNWHHVAVVYDGSTHKIYFDTVDVTNTSAPTPSGAIAASTVNTLEIGRFSSSYANEFNGQIDGVAIFNYALTDGTGGTVNQIATLYGSSSTGIGNPMSLSPAPVAYYPLGDQDAFNGADYLVPNSSLKDHVFNFTVNGQVISFGNDTSLKPSSNYTFSIWFKATSASYALFDTNSSTSSGVNALFTGTNITYYHRTTGGTVSTVFNGFIEDDWQNFTVTWSASTGILRGFVNGKYSGQALNSVSDIVWGNDLRVGAYFNNFFYKGEQSNFVMWNDTLTDGFSGTPTFEDVAGGQVAEVYNNGTPQTTITGTPVGWWKLDATATYDSSTTTWTIPDDSTNSNTGTSSVMTQANLVQSDLSFKSGYSPYALDFDSASSDYIDCGNDSSLDITGALSISFWIYGQTNPAHTGIITKTPTTSSISSAAQYHIQYQSSNQLRFLVTGCDLRATTETTGTAPTVDVDSWQHFTMTWNGTNEMIVYKNGVEAATKIQSTTIVSNTSDLLIGRRLGYGYLNGKMSNVSIWNAALSGLQVREIYNEGVPQNLNNHSAYSNLVSWWQLGSNSSFNTNWTVLDEKGSNNGTSANMTEVDIVDGVGSYANGLSSGMGGDEVIGDAPYSSSNSLSVNMDVEDRTTDTPS